MRWSRWTALALAACVKAQSSSTSTTTRVTVTQIVTESVSSILTVTVTETLTVTDGGSSTSSSIITPSNTVTPSSTSATTPLFSSSSVLTTLSTSTSTSSSSTTSSSTTTSTPPAVTDEAYIDTVLRHHNVHRANHTANALTWNSTLADTAKKLSDTCNYEHNTTIDGGGYGQNIGAGFLPTQMGVLISDAFYNSEVNSYTYYGAEPDTSTSDQWGHFTQIVWKATTSVGCYTTDCTQSGLQNAPGTLPFFTVCNYGPAGNVVPLFTDNVGTPLGNPTVTGDYECPSTDNCVGPTS